MVLMSGCTHIQTASDEGLDPIANVPTPKTLSEVLRQDVGGGPSTTLVTRNGDIIVQGIKLKNTHFDIPITINARVEYWMTYFRGRGRKHFQKYLERSEFFIPYIAPILKQNGLPEDLVYLAMIESGFNNWARSHAKAVGPWQFISATGRRYGLKVNWWVDQRKNIEKSTLAAASYLKDLYNLFQSWELAAASYNAGENKIARAIRQYGSRDFWVIAQHRYLKPETRDYVPKIIAAAILSKNRTQFGFPESHIQPGDGEAVAGDGEIVKVIKTDKPADAAAEQDIEDVLSSDAEMDDDTDKDLTPNPLQIQQADRGQEVEPTLISEQHTPAPLAKPIQTPHVTKKGEVGGEELAEFEVQSPADLLKIARAAGLSYSTVKSLNPEVLRWCTPPQLKTYRIQLPSSVKDKFLATYNHEAFPRKVQFMSYKVRKGDNLLRVARNFGIKVDPISDLNGLHPRVPLRNGSTVLLPVPNDRSRTFASLEVRDPPELRRSKRRVRRQRYYRLSYKSREAARSLRSRRGSQG